MSRICVNNLKAGYQKKEVLFGIDFTIEASQCIGIVGANGSGKTTLFETLSGMKKPLEGTITINDTLVKKHNAQSLFKKYIGYVPQKDNLIEELTVIDNLCLWYSTKQKSEIPGQLLSVENMYQEKIRNLSMGMRKKVSIISALAANPQILLLDEPDASLDIISKQQIKDYLRSFKEDGGTILLATHEEGFLDICDRIFSINHGKVNEISSDLRGKQLTDMIQQ